MANFVGILDPDHLRRRRFLARARAQVSLLPGLDVQTREHGDFALAWAAAQAAPVDVDQDKTGLSVLWGRAYRIGNGPDLSAQEVRASAGSGLTGDPPLADGYHAYVSYDSRSGLRLGADLLGLFPVYFWERGGVLLFGSSAHLFAGHPDFSPKVDPAGLVGILLTMHLVGGRTLMEGVRRLAPGCVLTRGPAGPARETRQYHPPVSEDSFSLGVEAQADRLAEALSGAMRRHVLRGPCPLLSFSGGLDSRMIAGFLRENGLDFEALTLGLPSDIEFQCARRVARHLHVRQQRIEIPFAEYRELADRAAAWEQLASGFNCIHTWGLTGLLGGGRVPQIVTGYLSDAVVGGGHIAWSYDPARGEVSFDALFNRINAWALRPEVVKRLLRHEARHDLVDDVIRTLRTTHDAYEGHPDQRMLSFTLQHRQRFHVGGNLWPLSFAAWPAAPMVDHAVLKFVHGLPGSSLQGRRLQARIVTRRFPGLARLPLDHNSQATRPLAPSLAWRVRNRLRREARRLLRAGAETRPFDRLYYYRIFDFNHPGWRAVRHAADDARGALAEILDEKVLAEVLPSAVREVHLDNPIVGASSLKTLAGLALWRRAYASAGSPGTPGANPGRPEEANVP